MSPESNKQPGNPSPDPVTAGGWSDKTKIRRKAFPGPPGSTERLRIAMTRQAYADLTAHAKESLNAEICGVLFGEQCEDDSGPFVSVEGIIRGAAARQASTHVTFTQETWTQIHAEMEKKHPKQQIVGWYHSHPGFGVEFSEMDLFVQRNFFAGAGQIAFVVDPLGGEESILVNVGGDILPVARFWVEGRERRCYVESAANSGSASDAQVSAAVKQAMESMDNRLGQLIQMVDAQTESLRRFLLTVGMIVAVGVFLFLAFTIYRAYTDENRPPEIQSFVPVPVKIGDKTVLLGIGILKWDVPSELNAALLQLERERQDAARAAAKAAAATMPSNEPTTLPSIP